VIRDAASVILLRRTAAGFEVFLVRRHRGARFMASSFVFPGGVAEPGEDARTTAARELFEEAGVLLVSTAVDDLASLRARILAGEPATDVLVPAGVAFATDVLVPWSHWITPSTEPRRYSARFFVAELPAGQEPRFDRTETVDQVWVTPEEALARRGELQLPPPQIRTCWELAACTTLEAVLAAATARGREVSPILPRLAPAERPCLLLPWDPDYATRGTGEAAPLTDRPAWARGPSRFVLEDQTWSHIDAPGSTTAR
jgi:8-oxo-dGTP pyrophosphatase MutT (NUDIX family)